MELPRVFFFVGLVALLLTAVSAKGQVVRYRDGDSPKLLTVAEVDSIVRFMSNRAKAAGYEFRARIDKTITRPDTIIHYFTLSGTHTREAESAHQQQLTALVGKPLPAFLLENLQGGMVSSKSFLGKPVVLNLWFTACAPCIAEMPWLNQIRKAKARTDVVFLAVTFNSKDKVYAFLRKHPFTFRHLVGAKRYCTQFTSGYPTTLFIDRSGIVRRMLGVIPITYDELTGKPVGADFKDFNEALKLIQ
jgi:cytochrome c biogenesis protein CcmG, thiol:disulfide interchange protein DsbE